MVGLALGLFRFFMEFGYQAPTCISGRRARTELLISMGIIRMTHLKMLSIVFTGEIDTRAEWIRWFVDDVHYLHYGCIIFLVTLAVTYGVSFTAPAIHPSKLHRLTFWTRHSPEIREPLEDESPQVNGTQQERKSFTNYLPNILLLRIYLIHPYFALQQDNLKNHRRPPKVG